jgi:2-amino-4-hydroxy-6-hydroxymethyldihydropteridine diphosphokinase
VKGARAGIALVGLGANLGDRAATFDRVREAWRSVPGTELLASSASFANAALDPSQPEFLNAVDALDTELEPHALLDELLAIEARLGRVRRERWSARPIDLDLLAWVPAGSARSRVIADDRLVLPHPRAHERDFVLIPLCELWPSLVLAGRTVAELRDACYVRRAGG